MRLNIEFKFKGLDNVVEDEHGKIYRLPFIDTSGKERQLHECKPKNYRGLKSYSILKKRYSEKVLEGLRYPDRFSVEIS